ncbi:MAG TPA: NADH-quinone oxidoreductase subunit F, partial [Syntrophobacteria bacterium]|nr:NADH-quinone oxidoreductase subunit F [Syntrophobacteria bacterium]
MYPQVLFQNRKPDRIATLAEYKASGGYSTLAEMFRIRSPREVEQLVLDAALLGRGGAGFPAGKKWLAVPEDAPHPRYLVCNADEMEPGTFKDRLLMEGDPHLLVESIILSAYAVQAEVCYIFLRYAYVGPARLLERAIAEAAAAGYVGRNVLGSGFDLEIHLHRGSGRYICGEETGLLNALEGRRATPRSKPPFPPVSGLFGKP